MTLKSWIDAGQRLMTQGTPRTADVVELAVSAEDWCRAAQDAAESGARLVSLWASDHRGEDIVRAALIAERSLLILRLTVTDERYPGIEPWFPSAGRMQRAILDLHGLRAGEDTRPWLRHAAWPVEFHPLRDADAPSASGEANPEAYSFVTVQGDGVHEVPVGPVHAGIIEPGHFRFSIVGEKVLRLEERLGYVHKGIERRFTELPLLEGHRLAARVSGDSAVAFSWAYCQALEGMCGIHPPRRGAWLRALALELERLANHLGDLGALGNDAGFAFGLTQFSRLKEELLRATDQALGQRYLMDFVVPGGTRLDLSESAATALNTVVESIATEVRLLRSIYEDHAGLRDRFLGAGIVRPALARRLGLTGLAGRASGQAFDLRSDLPCEPYHELSPRKVVHSEGDVGARVHVRFEELVESVRLIKVLCQGLAADSDTKGHRAHVPLPSDGAFGVGLIEGWRGAVLVALEAGDGGRIKRCHPHDPSWHNWPVLEHAIIDNIVPDFPLINKSFNLSYSGHDL